MGYRLGAAAKNNGWGSLLELKVFENDSDFDYIIIGSRVR
jgi:hypothetical protein